MQTAQPSPWHTGLAAVLADESDYLAAAAARTDRAMAVREALEPIIDLQLLDEYIATADAREMGHNDYTEG